VPLADEDPPDVRTPVDWLTGAVFCVVMVELDQDSVDEAEPKPLAPVLP
jgi:hypothetical protein